MASLFHHCLSAVFSSFPSELILAFVTFFCIFKTRSHVGQTDLELTLYTLIFAPSTSQMLMLQVCQHTKRRLIFLKFDFLCWVWAACSPSLTLNLLCKQIRLWTGLSYNHILPSDLTVFTMTHPFLNFSCSTDNFSKDWRLGFHTHPFRGCRSFKKRELFLFSQESISQQALTQVSSI